LPVVPGFKYDLFVSYAHLDDTPWRGGENGWVTEFVQTLRDLLKREDRSFQEWFDPKIRTGSDFNLTILGALSGSAVLLCVLSPAFDDSPYCKKEIAEFRACPQPAFGLKVGTMSRIQAIVLEDLLKDKWPPDLRSTSPHRFFDPETGRFSKPEREDEAHPYVKGIRRTRDSILETLREMRRQKEQGIAVDIPYRTGSSEGALVPTVCLADVPDDLFNKRENLIEALKQARDFRVKQFPEVSLPLGALDISIHMFGKYPGAPAPEKEFHASRLQLEMALGANPSRRPLVWLARDLHIEEAETAAHGQFLTSLLSHRGIELIRMGFEDLKDEILERVTSPRRKTRGVSSAPIIHIWHQRHDAEPLSPLRQHLKENNCGISMYEYSRERLNELQSKLSFCDGLMVSYSQETKSWAEDAMSEAFQLRRSEERPLAFAAVGLSPLPDCEFNFEHPRVVSIRSTAAGSFEGMTQFLEKLQEQYV
jgi:TIR domain